MLGAHPLRGFAIAGWLALNADTGNRCFASNVKKLAVVAGPALGSFLFYGRGCRCLRGTGRQCQGSDQRGDQGKK